LAGFFIVTNGWRKEPINVINDLLTKDGALFFSTDNDATSVDANRFVGHRAPWRARLRGQATSKYLTENFLIAVGNFYGFVGLATHRGEPMSSSRPTPTKPWGAI